jgi:hypothetical protein
VLLNLPQEFRGELVLYVDFFDEPGSSDVLLSREPSDVYNGDYGAQLYKFVGFESYYDV